MMEAFEIDAIRNGNNRVFIAAGLLKLPAHNVRNHGYPIKSAESETIQGRVEAHIESTAGPVMACRDQGLPPPRGQASVDIGFIAVRMNYIDAAS